MSARIKLLDSVMLLRDYDEWPAGTAGAVVLTFPDAVEVEIVGPDGRCLALLTVPYDDLAVIGDAQEQRAH